MNENVEKSVISDFIKFEIVPEGVKISCSVENNTDNLGRFAALLYQITTAQQNVNITSTLTKYSKEKAKEIISAWGVLINLYKDTGPLIKPSQAIKR